jgi:hypothetical protein
MAREYKKRPYNPKKDEYTAYLSCGHEEKVLGNISIKKYWCSVCNDMRRVKYIH